MSSRSRGSSGSDSTALRRSSRLKSNSSPYSTDQCPNQRRASYSAKATPKVKVEPVPPPPLSSINERPSTSKVSTRESDLCQKEAWLESERARLIDQANRLREKEQQAQQLIRDTQARISDNLLALVDEHLQCPLCLDIVAAPYILVPADCGHSFCAECVLKWYFSVLHDDCGCWHECCACPICRRALPYTRFETPRNLLLIPFTPNRMAEKFVSDFMEKRRVALSDASTAEAKAGLQALDEWQARTARGVAAMQDLCTRWETLSSADFLAIKRGLGL